MPGEQNFLRRRSTATKLADAVIVVDAPVRPSSSTRREEVVWGKTPGGEVFRVPTTHDVLTALFHPAYPKSHFDILNLVLLGSQIVLFYYLPRNIASIFFVIYFAFWRASYDAGLGYVLTLQSKKKWIVREMQRLGWLDKTRHPKARNWIRKQLVGKMGKDYSFDELPLEYNTWLLFRQVVDVILINDFVSYCMFAFTCFRVPEGLSFGVHLMRWLGGMALIGFNVWVKTEAHNVVKDYGWYWGDVFFQRGALIFDGVFELAPHPMYSVGYAGYYGLSLICGSYKVLFVSIAAHAAQFAFLVFFENPHIERMYGQRKAIAKRTPLHPTSRTRSSVPLPSESESEADNGDIETPAVTEGDTATETELDTETEIEEGLGSVTTPVSFGRHKSQPSNTSSTSSLTVLRKKVVSQHDLLNIYFRRDTVILKNFDFLRANDFMFMLVAFYAIWLIISPPLGSQGTLALHFIHSLAWSLFSCFGLGTLLRAQSENKFLVRHFMKHYHYKNDSGKGAVVEAFANWKSIYNLTVVMSYISFIGLVWKTYSIPVEWTVGDELLRHTIGVALISFHVWAAIESYEALGAFGWFFGDFFMEEFPTHLEYSGIYRYLNNPEVIGGVAWLGLACISGSKLVLSLAILHHLSHWWFLSHVENPHMKKLYGDSLRNDAGFVKVIKGVVGKNVRTLDVGAKKHAPELRRVAKAVTGTFDKVFEETADAVEEFLAKSGPKLSEVVQDTKVLLQQSKERLIITRVADDISSYDTTKYSMAIIPACDGTLRFHLGEPIFAKWQAPGTHSRKDWIGIYKVGANKSNLVTKITSKGLWVPIYDEWDGDVFLGPDNMHTPTPNAENGTVAFKGEKLPWSVGRYEIRYHHDGKHNVMSLGGPFEIYVDKPAEITFDSVRESLMRIVTLCLDNDPSLIPLSCKCNTPRLAADTEDMADPDDFAFWSERQAKRICDAIKQTFDVEYVPEVVVADANLTALANRILSSKEILT